MSSEDLALTLAMTSLFTHYQNLIKEAFGITDANRFYSLLRQNDYKANESLDIFCLRINGEI